MFQLDDGVKTIHIKYKPYFQFWMLIFSLATYMWYNTFKQCAGAGVASLRWDHDSGQPIHLQAFGFSLLVQYSINYMRNSIVYYKIGFVLVSFAQLQANISVLSTFKV